MNDKTARPQDVVQQQLDAYNARDIDAFMACWADDAQYYEHPDTLLPAARRRSANGIWCVSGSRVCMANG